MLKIEKKAFYASGYLYMTLEYQRVYGTGLKGLRPKLKRYRFPDVLKFVRFLSLK